MTQPFDPNQPPPPQPPPYGAPPPQPYGYPQYGYQQYGNPQYGYPQQYGPPPGQRVNDPAPMGMRLLARIIDGILVGVVSGIVAYALGFHLFSTSTTISSDGTTHNASFQLYNGAYFKFFFITLILTGIYEVLMLTSRGATLGKMAVSVRVAMLADGSNPDVGAAAVRWIIPGAAGIFFLLQWLVYLSPFFDSTKRNRGWHDYAAKTIAVRTK